jgi:hypothetical protein
MESFKCILIFFSTFQFLELASESQSPMQSEGGMLYESGPWDPAVGSSKKPVLHLGYLEHVLWVRCNVKCYTLLHTSTHYKNYYTRQELITRLLILLHI